MSKEEYEAISAVNDYLRGMATEMTVRAMRKIISDEEQCFWFNSWKNYSKIAHEAMIQFYNIKQDGCHDN